MSRTPRILVLSPYPAMGASVRFRILQYVPALEAAGFKVTFHPFMNPRLFGIRRCFGLKFQVRKALLFVWASLLLSLRLLSAKAFDVCLIHREAFPVGPPFVEGFLKRLGLKIIFDFDDALFARPTTGINQRFWTDDHKFEKVLRLSDQVIAGSDFLADVARERVGGRDLTVLPTAVDTERFKPPAKRNRSMPPVIGWVGNWGNAVYLADLRNVFTELSTQYRFVVKVVGGTDIFDLDIGCETIRVLWSLEREVDDLLDFDIGIMPLSGGTYDEGKCGFKIIQYFSLAIPAVASSMGANKTIIKNGVNGFLVDSKEGWLSALARLISDQAERSRMGLEGRKTVLEHYSTQVVSPLLVDIVRRTLGAC